MGRRLIPMVAADEVSVLEAKGDIGPVLEALRVFSSEADWRPTEEEEEKLRLIAWSFNERQFFHAEGRFAGRPKPPRNSPFKKKLGKLYGHLFEAEKILREFDDMERQRLVGDAHGIRTFGQTKRASTEVYSARVLEPNEENWRKVAFEPEISKERPLALVLEGQGCEYETASAFFEHTLRRFAALRFGFDIMWKEIEPDTNGSINWLNEQQLEPKNWLLFLTMRYIVYFFGPHGLTKVTQTFESKKVPPPFITLVRSLYEFANGPDHDESLKELLRPSFLESALRSIVAGPTRECQLTCLLLMLPYSSYLKTQLNLGERLRACSFGLSQNEEFPKTVEGQLEKALELADVDLLDALKGAANEWVSKSHVGGPDFHPTMRELQSFLPLPYLCRRSKPAD